VLIKETEGSEEFPGGTDGRESRVIEGNGGLAGGLGLATGGSGEPLVPERAELGADSGRCQK